MVVAVCLRNDKVIRRYPGTELDRIGVGVQIGDGVLPITTVEDIDVVAPPATKPVVARAADQRVVSAAGIEHVVAGTAGKKVRPTIPA